MNCDDDYPEPAKTPVELRARCPRRQRMLMGVASGDLWSVLCAFAIAILTCLAVIL